MSESTSWSMGPVAVMASGGPDSAVLVGELAASSPRVVPVYVRFGMTWDHEEEETLRSFLHQLAAPVVSELKVFSLPLREVYGRHWSTTGEGVPDAASDDSAVFLPGRNVLVLAQAAIWCHLNGLPTLALGLLKGNPFPDSTPAFFAQLEQVVNRAVGGNLRVVCPYRQLSKVEVLQRGRSFPLGATWSCMKPVQGRHCGACNKCAERRRAFAEAGLPDPTQYAT